ncbi:MAG: alpha/beta fold hydrolase [Anaerolineales bacterium]|nr:alpha/beta fold hydrolase [Anaerolineales bacterium]
MTQTIPSAEPFFFPGNRTGVLLVHGFTGAPKEMRWMGEYLNEQGYTCLGIRLAGHATTPEDMIRSRRADWTASVEDGYNLLRDSTERVFFVGLSMGGILSLLMAARLKVSGVVAMSTPYELPGGAEKYPTWTLKLFSRFQKYLIKSNETPGASWFDKDAYHSHVSYPFNPTRSVAELKELLKEMREALPAVNAPTLLIHSKNDHYVLPENMERIYAALTNVADKSKAYVVESGHVIPRDAARLQAFELTRDFIQRVERA